MKLSNAKNYLSLNLLALLGYMSLFVLLCYIFLVVPEIRKLDKLVADGGFEYALFTGAYFYYYYYFAQIIITFILFLLSIVELIFKNKGKTIKLNSEKVPTFLLKLHPYIFWLGIFFVFIPIYFLILIYVVSPIISTFSDVIFHLLGHQMKYFA